VSEAAGIYEAFRDAIRAEEPAALATIIDGPDAGEKLLVQPGEAALGTLGDPDLDRVVERDALGMLDAGISEVRHYGQHGEARQMDLSVFVECHARRPHMVIFGAVDFTRALASQAKLLGYRVTVCDAREVFATKRRFPMADEVIVDWPNRLLDRIGDELGPRDAVCVLTHDHKFDVPAIVGALPTRVGYLGAMGSRTTHEKRTRGDAAKATDTGRSARACGESVQACQASAGASATSSTSSPGTSTAQWRRAAGSATPFRGSTAAEVKASPRRGSCWRRWLAAVRP